MKFLITSDIHLSDKPRDAYRFGLFPWLLAQQKIHRSEITFILGDITEFKDRHSASLVNKLVESLMMLKSPVYILKGNHDYIDAGTPFFKFLSNIDGVHFVSQALHDKQYKFSMIPHQPGQVEFDMECHQVPKGHSIMLHQTIQGAIAETGGTLTGLQWPLSGFDNVYSGDVHKPQKVGPVTYIGAPYRVRFGDEYTPRVLLVDSENNQTDLHFPAPKKAILRIRSPDEIATQGLQKGDQVKITLELAREEVVQWSQYKEQILHVCRELSLEVYGVELKVSSSKRERIKLNGASKTPYDHFKAFCSAEQVPQQMSKVGAKIIGG